MTYECNVCHEEIDLSSTEGPKVVCPKCGTIHHVYGGHIDPEASASPCLKAGVSELEP